MKRIVDVTLHVSDAEEQEHCVDSIMYCHVITLRNHTGIVVHLKPCKLHDGCKETTIQHTGHPSCDCKTYERL